MAKIAQLTARYIADHPMVKECLLKDIINFSKLSRKIASEIGISNLDAVIVACRRYASALRKGKKEETKKQFRLAAQMAPNSKSGQQAQARLIKLENFLIMKNFNLPFGLSLICIIKKNK